MNTPSKGYWTRIWDRYRSSSSGIFGGVVVAFFILLALYAPFFASSKPLFVVYQEVWYFPLFRYLFSHSFFTKPLDIFYNICSIALPLSLATLFFKRRRAIYLLFIVASSISFFWYVTWVHTLDPTISLTFNKEKKEAIEAIQKENEAHTLIRSRYPLPSWDFDLAFMTPYAKLNTVIGAREEKKQDEHLRTMVSGAALKVYSIYSMRQEHIQETKEQLLQEIQKKSPRYMDARIEEELLRKKLFENRATDRKGDISKKLQKLVQENTAFEILKNRYQFLVDREEWVRHQEEAMGVVLMPLLRPFTWEDDVGGSRELNDVLPFFELTRINRHDLVAALIFGARISLFVGIAACSLAFMIGVPLGLVSGFYGGRLDIVLCRLVEVWESMPTFFMLLLLVALLQTKSIFLVIAILGVFGWTTSFRFVRAECFRQRELLYVEACRALGFGDIKILFGHILPNSLVAILALLPFDIMAAITRETALAFLGLGEESSCSWGVLMDEGRASFPAESALLWPPASILTILLIAIAFVGETLRKAMDPKSVIS